MHITCVSDKHLGFYCSCDTPPSCMSAKLFYSQFCLFFKLLFLFDQMRMNTSLGMILVPASVLPPTITFTSQGDTYQKRHFHWKTKHLKSLVASEQNLILLWLPCSSGKGCSRSGICLCSAKLSVLPGLLYITVQCHYLFSEVANQQAGAHETTAF